MKTFGYIMLTLIIVLGLTLVGFGMKSCSIARTHAVKSMKNAVISYDEYQDIYNTCLQLTNTMQLVKSDQDQYWEDVSMPSPAEDGSYETNGDAIFGFTPEGTYIETNMKYITSTVPLNFRDPVNRLAIITTEQAKQMLDISKKAMDK